MLRRLLIAGLLLAALLARPVMAEDRAMLAFAASRVQFWSPRKVTLERGELRFIFPIEEVDAKAYHPSIKWLCKGMLMKPEQFRGVTSVTFLNRSAKQGYVYEPKDQPLLKKCAAMAGMFSLNDAFASFIRAGTRIF